MRSVRQAVATVADLIRVENRGTDKPEISTGHQQLLRKTMNLQKAIEIAGSKSKLATLLGVSRAAVTQWDELPEKRVQQLKGINEWQTHFSGERGNNPSVSNSSASETSPQ